MDTHRWDEHLQADELGLAERLTICDQSSNLSQRAIKFRCSSGNIDVALKSHIGEDLTIEVWSIDDLLLEIFSD